MEGHRVLASFQQLSFFYVLAPYDSGVETDSMPLHFVHCMAVQESLGSPSPRSSLCS